MVLFLNQIFAFLLNSDLLATDVRRLVCNYLLLQPKAILMLFNAMAPFNSTIHIYCTLLMWYRRQFIVLVIVMILTNRHPERAPLRFWFKALKTFHKIINNTWCVQVLRSPKEAFVAAMQSWRERCEKCVCLQGDYIEKLLHFQLPVVSSLF